MTPSPAGLAAASARTGLRRRPRRLLLGDAAASGAIVIDQQEAQAVCADFAGSEPLTQRLATQGVTPAPCGLAS